MLSTQLMKSIVKTKVSDQDVVQQILSVLVMTLAYC